jgi:hypothetical protein
MLAINFHKKIEDNEISVMLGIVHNTLFEHESNQYAFAKSGAYLNVNMQITIISISQYETFESVRGLSYGDQTIWKCG